MKALGPNDTQHPELVRWLAGRPLDEDLERLAAAYTAAIGREQAARDERDRAARDLAGLERRLPDADGPELARLVKRRAELVAAVDVGPVVAAELARRRATRHLDYLARVHALAAAEAARLAAEADPHRRAWTDAAKAVARLDNVIGHDREQRAELEAARAAAGRAAEALAHKVEAATLAAAVARIRAAGYGEDVRLDDPRTWPDAVERAAERARKDAGSVRAAAAA